MQKLPICNPIQSIIKKQKQKLEAYYDPSNNVAFAFMVGNQVAAGTLDHYENIHFKKNIILCPNPTKPGQPTFIKSDYPIDKIKLLSIAGQLLYKSDDVQNQRFYHINEN